MIALTIMKINPTDQCLSLILHTLDVTVLPEVTSASARRTIELISATLGELLKRQQEPARNFIAQCIKDGLELEVDFHRVLNYPVTTAQSGLTDNAPFEALANQYDLLTERLNKLCVQASASTSKNSSYTGLLRRAAEWEMGYLTGQAKLTARPFGDESSETESPTPLPPLRDFLEEFLTERHGPLEVTDFSEIPGGFGKETYFCTVKHATGSIEELVVRKSQPVPMVLHGGFLLEREFQLLRALSQTDYPVPRPIDLALDLPGVESTFFTMTRIPGKVLGSFLDGENQKLPEPLFRQLAELLAKLHAIPLETFADYFAMHNESAALNETIEARHRRNLKGWREYMERVEHLPSPYITWLFHWLENHIPADSRLSVLTHGDFSVHNILAENGQVTGVLDWECADFGAPEQDLAYIRPHVSKHMDWEIFVAHYCASGGQEVDERNMRFCLAYGVLRTFIGGTRGSWNLQKGFNRDIRYVMMELGFAPAFMKIGLDYTAAGASQSIRVSEIPPEDVVPAEYGASMIGKVEETDNLARDKVVCSEEDSGGSASAKVTREEAKPS